MYSRRGSFACPSLDHDLDLSLPPPARRFSRAPRLGQRVRRHEGRRTGRIAFREADDGAWDQNLRVGGPSTGRSTLLVFGGFQKHRGLTNRQSDKPGPGADFIFTVSCVMHALVLSQYVNMYKQL